MDESAMDIVERSPRQWRVPGPRWLLVTIAALVLAGGLGTALTASGGRPGGTRSTGAHAQATAVAATCHWIIGPISRAALANGMPESRDAAGCTPSPAGNVPAGSSGVRSTTLCLPLNIRSGQRAAHAGVHRRCFHSLA